MGKAGIKLLGELDKSKGLTATADDIAFGKTALVNGQIINGSRKPVTKNLECYAGEFSAKYGGTYENYVSPGFVPSRVIVRFSGVPKFWWKGLPGTDGTMLFPLNTDIVYAPTAGEVKFATLYDPGYYIGIDFFLAVENGNIRIKADGDGYSGWSVNYKYTCKIFGVVTFEP